MTGGDTARDLLAEALGLAPGEVGEATALESCEAWDSLAHFRIVTALEARLGRSLDPMEIVGLRGFADVAKLLG